MQTLANCKPSEFLRQTSRIRKAVANWIDLTDIIGIRNRKPELIKLDKSMTQEERDKAFFENARRSQESVKENAMAVLDAALDKHPDETLEVLALCCFIEPQDVDNYKVADFLNCFRELIEDEAVIGFFTSLVSLESRSTSTASNPSDSIS